MLLTLLLGGFAFVAHKEHWKRCVISLVLGLNVSYMFFNLLFLNSLHLIRW